MDSFASLFFDCTVFGNVDEKLLGLLQQYPLCFVFAESVTDLPENYEVKYVVFVNSKSPPITLAFVFSAIWRVQFFEYAFDTRLDRIDVVRVASDHLTAERCFFWSVRQGFLLSRCSVESEDQNERILSDGVHAIPFDIR